MDKKSGLLISVGLILSLGLTTIWSTAPSLFLVQVSYLLIGFLVALIFYKFDMSTISGLSMQIYFLTISLLVLTILFGQSARGATRWLLGMQTSEIAKPLLIISYAGFLTKHRLDRVKNLIIYIFLTLIPVILVKVQPDLGSSLVLFALSSFMGIFAGISGRKIAVLLFFLLLFIPVAPYFLHDYQLDRLESFWNPYHDPRGKGYNVIQSVIAIGSSGLLGKGVRLGTQSHLNFLPERHTDFIFASFAEEFGLLGIIAILLAYYYLLTKLLDIAKNTRDGQNRYLALGVFSVFSFQTLVNIGMNLGILPVTGITLPFFSYGGSSLISFTMLLGISLRLLELNPIHRI